MYRERQNEYYSNVINTDIIYNMNKTPFDLFFGGYIQNALMTYVGLEGPYWASTASSSDWSYYLIYAYTGTYPSTNYYRYYGYSIRCLAR